MALPTTEHRQIEGWATVKGEIDSLLEGDGFELPVPRGSRDGAVLHGIASDPQPYLSITICITPLPSWTAPGQDTD
jgi:hypothetical protein